MKRFIVTLILTILITCAGCANAQAYSITVDGVAYTYGDLDTLQNLIDEQISIMNAAHDMAEAARQLTYDEDHDVITLAKEEWDTANGQREKYQNAYDALVNNHEDQWAEKSAEYPIATTTWRYLTEDLGYNNYVAAGILGNMMAETGGHTLDISTIASNGNYYGLCQWSLIYAPSLANSSLYDQLNYLSNTIKNEFNNFGGNYKKNFNYSNFVKLKDSKAAAEAFALCYERCDAKTIGVRQSNAVIAYKYFTS